MRNQNDRGAARRTAVSTMFVGLLVAGLAMPLVLVLVLANTALAAGPNPIVHRVSAGGPDACIAYSGGFFEHPGCDGNFSLVAIQRADGSVTGQYSDRFANDDGLHAVIDCLDVDEATGQAWVSGTITELIFGGVDLVPLGGDWFFVASVKDNGNSANDPVDQISFTFIELDGDEFPFIGPCTVRPDVQLFDAPQGQVKVE